MKVSYRLQTSFAALAPLLVAMLAVVGAVKGGTALLAVGGLAALCVAAIMLSVRPQDLFLVWLLAAPFLQDVGHGGAQHAVRILLFSSPPLLFLAWALLERRSIRGSFIDLLPACYVLLVAGSAILTHSPTSATQVFSIIGIGVIVYYFCAFATLDDDIDVRVLRVLLATSVIAALLTVLGRVSGLNFGYAKDTSSGFTRSTGPLGDPVYLGTFLGAGFVIALAVLTSGTGRLRKLAIVALLSTGPALLLTLTRGPIIAAIGIGLLILLLRARSRWPAVAGAAILGLIIAALWGNIASTTLYKDRFSNKTNIQGRLLIDRWSFELAGRKPVLGWGYGSFDRVKNSANLSSGTLPLAFGLQYTSHNTFLTILVEMGVLGLIILFLPWASAAISGLRVAIRSPGSLWIVTALIATIGVWVINAGTADMRFFPFAWVLPWVSVGLLRRRFLDAAWLGPPRVR
jgi:O-antigen ligase